MRTGYWTRDGYYRGLVGNCWITFVSYEEYLEVLGED